MTDIIRLTAGIDTAKDKLDVAVHGSPARLDAALIAAAALAGLAPFDDDSGKHRGARHIAGGRDRLRHSLYAAALPAAFRWNPALMAMYARLVKAGKKHKVALIACARKLLIYANTVVARGTPWVKDAACA